MQRSLLKSILGVAIAVAAFAADKTLGTWKLNLEKSHFSPTAPVRSLTISREQSDGGVKTTTTGEQLDGTAIHASYTAKYDGKEYDVTGAPYDTISFKQLNAHTFTFAQKKKGGTYNVTGRSAISPDGKTMTNTVNGTNAQGDTYSATMVWDKQ
jgi:hypothetical protein